MTVDTHHAGKNAKKELKQKNKWRRNKLDGKYKQCY